MMIWSRFSRGIGLLLLNRLRVLRRSRMGSRRCRLWLGRAGVGAGGLGRLLVMLLSGVTLRAREVGPRVFRPLRLERRAKCGLLGLPLRRARVLRLHYRRVNSLCHQRANNLWQQRANNLWQQRVNNLWHQRANNLWHQRVNSPFHLLRPCKAMAQLWSKQWQQYRPVYKPPHPHWRHQMVSLCRKLMMARPAWRPLRNSTRAWQWQAVARG